MKLQRYESIRKVTLSVCSLSLVILSFISINVSSEHTNSNAQRKQKFTQDDLNSYRYISFCRFFFHVKLFSERKFCKEIALKTCFITRTIIIFTTHILTTS
jgi:hypothetical protein